ncbi:MAG: hypothetical protein Q9204_003379 [Flavoplaca sp. TL-2023a]
MSFFSLPNELKYHILNYIAHDTNTLHALRQVHPWFRSQISKLDLRKEVLAAPIPIGYLVCHTCFRILPGDEFESFEETRYGDTWGARLDDIQFVALAFSFNKWKTPRDIMLLSCPNNPQIEAMQNARPMHSELAYASAMLLLVDPENTAKE